MGVQDIRYFNSKTGQHKKWVFFKRGYAKGGKQHDIEPSRNTLFCPIMGLESYTQDGTRYMRNSPVRIWHSRITNGK